jgi:UDP-N-acetylmuramoyl-L-alanyl-D-glutamate--2,6-diaminopimelate ligase
VFVDYAHTDDALRNVLTTLRELTASRLTVVFGCGGDRDRSKRPLMGAVAAELADRVYLTSDNPRSEDPGAILENIRSGMPGSAAVEVIVDREAAIARALTQAGKGDTVLIAGKGHENYQEFAHTVIPFDDREVTRRLLG